MEARTFTSQVSPFNSEQLFNHVVRSYCNSFRSQYKSSKQKKFSAPRHVFRGRENPWKKKKEKKLNRVGSIEQQGIEAFFPRSKHSTLRHAATSNRLWIATNSRGQWTGSTNALITFARAKRPTTTWPTGYIAISGTRFGRGAGSRGEPCARLESLGPRNLHVNRRVFPR